VNELFVVDIENVVENEVSIVIVLGAVFVRVPADC
jgi:hypothetical protein